MERTFKMRSMKLLAATAVLAALVAGPVLASEDAGGTMAPATETTKTTTVKHHAHKKPVRHKKPTGAATTPSSESAVTPAK
jgi:hypothetical protein